MFVVTVLVTPLLFGLYVYYGGLYAVKVRIETTGGEVMVFKKVTGDYKQTRSVTNGVYNCLLDDLHIKTCRGIGIFYDRSGHVKKEELGSKAGCIVESGDIPKLDTILGKYEVKRLPDKESAVAEFPYKGGISVLIGLNKVYPELEEQVKTRRLPDRPAVEIYDMPHKKITYRK